MRKLIELGVSEAEATAKTPLYEAADAALDSLGADRHRWSLWVPGRIEVLGKHTDYAGGRSLVCALGSWVDVHMRYVEFLGVGELVIDADGVYNEVVVGRGDEGVWIGALWLHCVV